jgi:hypothetical protein
MEKIDPYKHKERYENWKEKVKQGIPGISKENSDIIFQYITDMEMGINVANGNKKGSRSYNRLNSLKLRMIFLAKKFGERGKDSLIELSEKELFQFFLDMRQGKITRKDGKIYISLFCFLFTFCHQCQKALKSLA